MLILITRAMRLRFGLQYFTLPRVIMALHNANEVSMWFEISREACVGDDAFVWLKVVCVCVCVVRCVWLFVP